MGNTIKCRRVVFSLLALIALLATGTVMAAEPVTIDYMVWAGAVTLPYQQEMVAAFEASHPHIKVNLITTSFGGYKDKLTTMLAGGTPPDLAVIDAQWLHEFVAKGLIMDVTDWIKRDGYKLNETHPAYVQEMTVSGRMYSIANMMSSAVVYYYNKDELDKVGAADPYDINWNWQSFREMLKKLTLDTNGDGAVDRGGIQRQLDTWWQPFVFGNGGDYIDGVKKTESWTDKRTVEALQFLADLWHKDGVFAGWWDQRTAASYLMWGTAIATNQKNANFNWDVIVPPAGPVQQMTYIKGNMATIPVNANHKDAAWEMMKFLASEEGQYIFGSKGATFPVHRRAAMRVINESRGKAPAHYANLLDINARPLPLCSEYVALHNMILQEMKPLWGGKEPASATAQRLSELTRAIFAASK